MGSSYRRSQLGSFEMAALCSPCIASIRVLRALSQQRGSDWQGFVWRVASRRADDRTVQHRAAAPIAQPTQRPALDEVNVIIGHAIR